MKHLLPAPVARRLLGATVRFRETTAVLFDRAEGRQVVYERLDSPTARRARAFERNHEFIGAVDPLEDALVEDPIQLMYSGPVGADARAGRGPACAAVCGRLHRLRHRVRRSATCRLST